MKVWSKDKRYKYEKAKKEFRVYFENRLIARVFSEYDARKSIWVHLGRPEGVFVDKDEFEDWGDNEFRYPSNFYKGKE